MQRGEEDVSFQRQTIATLDGGGHEATAAKMFLGRLVAMHARHVAERDQLFKQLANRF